MTHEELLTKITELKALMNTQTELEKQIEALKNEVKEEMETQGTEKLTIGVFKVSYTKYTSNRFDTTAFKAKFGDLYKMYTKSVPTTRFTIN